MPATRTYTPSPEDLAALATARKRAGAKFKRAPRTMQDAIKRAYQIIKEDYKEENKDDFNACQKWVADEITESTGLTTAKSAEKYVPENPAVVDAFTNNNLGTGPTATDIKFDFRPGASFDSGWNLRCVDLLGDLTRAKLDMVPAHLKPKIPDNPKAYFRSVIINKMKTYHRDYRRARPQILPDGQPETEAQVSARTTAARNAANYSNKLNGRRSSLYSTRMDIVAEMQNRYKDNADTILLWVAIGKFVKDLGIDGMSDDEEDDDGTRPYNVMTVPWRNPEVVDWMDFIDERYHLIKAKTGSTLRRRARGGDQVSSREFVPNLPPWFYNREFKTIDAVTCNESDFQLPRVGLNSMDGLTERKMRERMAQ